MIFTLYLRREEGGKHLSGFKHHTEHYEADQIKLSDNLEAKSEHPKIAQFLMRDEPVSSIGFDLQTHGYEIKDNSGNLIERCFLSK